MYSHQTPTYLVNQAILSLLVRCMSLYSGQLLCYVLSCALLHEMVKRQNVDIFTFSFWGIICYPRRFVPGVFPNLYVVESCRDWDP